MWLSLIEKGEQLASVYGSDIPSLENLQLHELSVLSGTDVVIKVRLDLNQLPAQLPQKWIDRQVNCVQISLSMIAATIDFWNVKESISNVANIFIEQTEKTRVLKMRDKMQNDIIVVSAKWIYLTTFNGYRRTPDTVLQKP
jgi:hypothetical protein